MTDRRIPPGYGVKLAGDSGKLFSPRKSRMAHRSMTTENWAKLLHASPDGQMTVNGVSPGSAANELGISRQAVHKAIRVNRLDAIRIVNAHGRTTAVLITGAELRRFQLARASKNPG